MKKLAVLVLALMFALSISIMGCQKKEETMKPAETTAPAPAPEKKEEAAPAPAPEKKDEAAPAKTESAPAKKSAGGY
jgi:hypothetical protein